MAIPLGESVQNFFLKVLSDLGTHCMLNGTILQLVTPDGFRAYPR